MKENAEHLVRSAISEEEWDLDEFVLEFLGNNTAPLQAFDSVAIAFCSRLSQKLFDTPSIRDAPEVVALAFWLRRKPINDLLQAFQALESDSVVRCPIDRVFHIPPANVDTLFVYSWVLSLLAGNRNVVRISERLSPVVKLLLAVVGRTLRDSEFADLAQRNAFIFTGHDDVISAKLSLASDLRVVWGGDATVQHFRQFPIPVMGRELLFPDRHSIAVLSAESVVLASDEEMERIANLFFNDAYWFDQAACSSPRLLLWHDPDGRFEADARSRFKAAVSGAVVSRGYETTASMAIEKQTAGFQAAAERPVIDYQAESNEATWIQLSGLNGYDRDHCGGGLFYEIVSQDVVRDLGAFVTRKDQTASYYGLELELRQQLVKSLNGRGIDRWVPIGQALDFGRIWDGRDLLQEFTRCVVSLPSI